MFKQKHKNEIIKQMDNRYQNTQKEVEKTAIFGRFLISFLGWETLEWYLELHYTDGNSIFSDV